MPSTQKKVAVQKENLELTLSCYKTPNSIPLSFSFAPQSILDRSFSLKHYSLDGKNLYALNGYFSNNEGIQLRDFSLEASFSQEIYGNEESSQMGEVPAKMMNGKERWQFFANPPHTIECLFQLFSFLSQRLDAKVMTLPWCLSDEKTTSTCLATNFLKENSQTSEEQGKHQDYVPENGLAFSIPCLYGEEGECHPTSFINGDIGKPLMTTVMVYATAENFQPDYGMGTFFYDQKGKQVKIDCQHMQIVFFEGDTWHTIEKSQVPSDLSTWRVSYVFKIIFNPRKKDSDLRKALFEVLHGASDREIS